MRTEYYKLVETIAGLRRELIEHEVYCRLEDIRSLKIFMESHVFAVWDFMSLVKSLQQRLTCVSVPWMPPKNILGARLINEIVLGEETDEVAPGEYLSHFSLYIEGMREIGASTREIARFLDSLVSGQTLGTALRKVNIPPATKQFVLSTISYTFMSTHEVAAVFLLGREDVIPEMFRRVLENAYIKKCDRLNLYLERHIHLDEEVHAPMGEKLLCDLCGKDSKKWEQATLAAMKALLVRIEMWNGVAFAIKQ